MQETPTTEPRAVIEELDPEPGARQSRGHRLERVLGLLLVLALAGFGIGQWGDQQGKLAQYQAGARAAAAHDWDAASAAYSAAGGYGDAAARAANARRQIAERDTQYRRAVGAAAAGDWPGVLAATGRVQAVAPNYRNTGQLAQDAAAHAVPEVLSGTVALRPAATSPGLYAYGPGGWQWLRGSDAASRAQGQCPSGAILFDAPASPAAPGGAPAGPAPAGGAPAATRRIQVDAPDGTPLARLAFDPAQFDAYLCTPDGVWGLKQTTSTPGIRQRSPIRPTTYQATYQAFGSNHARPLALPGPAWSLLAIAPDGQHLFLLDTSGATIDQPTGAIYLADARGDGRRLLYTGMAAPWAMAEFSPSGPYGLLRLDQPFFARRPLTSSLLLFDTTANSPPRELTAAAAAAAPGGYRLRLAGTFVRGGPRAGQIAVLGPGAGGQMVRLFDPARPDAPPVEIPLDPALVPLSAAGTVPDRGGLLFGARRVATENPRGGSSVAVYLDPETGAHEIPLPLSAGDMLWGVWGRADHLIYASGPRTFSTQEQRIMTLYSLAGALGGGDSAPPVRLYSGILPIGPGSPTSPVRLGAGLLVYTTPGGDLHARTYDGAVDLPLESGVRELFSFDAADRP